MSEGVHFLHNKKPYPISLNKKLINKLPDNIAEELTSTFKYEIKSNAQDENIQSFVNYLQNEKIRLDINSNNAHDFYELSQEFEDDNLKKRIDEEHYDTLQRLFLKHIKTTKNGDMSVSEIFISEHLDEFLQNYANDMYQIPITSLYNIFYYKGRKLTDDLGYRFITKKLAPIDDDSQNTQSLFILLDSLDYSKLSEETMKDCLLNKDDHYGFIPKIDFGYIETMTKKVTEFESTLNKIDESHQGLVVMQREIEKNIAQLQEQTIKKLSEAQKKSQEENRILEAKINTLNTEIENMRIVLSENEHKAQDENSKLATEISYLKNIISKSQSDAQLSHDGLINQIACLNSTLSSQKTEINNLNNKLINEVINDFNQKLDRQQKSIDAFLAEDQKRRRILEKPEEVCKEMKEKILKDQIEALSLPFYLQRIPDSSFDDCKSLKKIDISSSVTSIGCCAFGGCSSLTSITIPSSVTSIGDFAFGGCSSLTNITIPSSVTSIGGWAFSECSSLTSIKIPSSVKSIGDFSFSECSSLTSITIPSSVTSIESDAFCKCSSLTSITIPSSVTSIESCAFDRCSSLTNITIPSSVTSIGDFSFSECSSLTSITIPSSVTSIGDFAFRGCSSLTNITIPSSVASIGDSAFSECSSLTSITIPSCFDWSKIGICSNVNVINT